MAADDLKALTTFLRTVPAVKRNKEPKRITVPLFESVFLPAWLAAFAPRETPPATAPAAGAARGEYLVRAVAHCGECHTPRTMTMATDNSRFLAGNPKGPEDEAIPNITPDRDTGLGKWSVDEIAEYLGTGNKPDGDVAGGLMGEVIEGTLAGYKDLSKADRLAIAQFLKTIPAVSNKVVKSGK
jgi:mono/diheme cytochrome c family protein